MLKLPEAAHGLDPLQIVEKGQLSQMYSGLFELSRLIWSLCVFEQGHFNHWPLVAWGLFRAGCVKRKSK